MNMDIGLLLNTLTTLEELYDLNDEKGYTFTIEDGQITEVIF